MELYTLNRNFQRQNVIDKFHSAIWTDRYYGDSEVELVVPMTPDLIKAIPVGTFLTRDESDEVMIIETANIEENKLKVKGISLLSWLNNRFIRTSAKHEDRYWYMEGTSPGWILWAIVYYMCVENSPYLTGEIDIGIPNPQRFAIPGLGLRDFDRSGGELKVGIPYGPVYAAMQEIATTYEIGMQITLDFVTDTSYFLGFRSYKGLDRTSGQNDNMVIRFSPNMDSFTNIKELQSIAALKTLVYSFAPSNPDGLATIPGESFLAGTEYVGFDLRALLIFADDITTDMVGGSQENLVNILNSRAYDGLTTNRFIKAVDGEIVPDTQFKYGVHYNLGDVIEVEGNSGIVSTARVTEYIRSQDASGEKAYPTVTMID